MTTDLDTVSAPTTVAKLFELGSGNQLVIYRDPRASDPTLIMSTSANGIRANSTMAAQGNPDTPLASKQALIEATFETFDEAKAKQVFGMLQASVKDHAPVLSLLQEVRGFTHGDEAPFAKLLTGPAGEQVLLVSEDDHGKAILKVVTATLLVEVPFRNSELRDRAFANPAAVDTVLPMPISSLLGIYPKTAPASRGPKP